MSEDLLDMWNEIKVLVESTDSDINKHARGNATAGVRSRKGLRLLKAKMYYIVKLSIAVSKEKLEEKSTEA